MDGGDCGGGGTEGTVGTVFTKRQVLLPACSLLEVFYVRRGDICSDAA